jgi:hypothetical protein
MGIYSRTGGRTFLPRCQWLDEVSLELEIVPLLLPFHSSDETCCKSKEEK